MQCKVHRTTLLVLLTFVAVGLCSLQYLVVDRWLSMLNSHVIYEVCINVLFVVAVREISRTEIHDKEYLGVHVKCHCNEN